MLVQGRSERWLLYNFYKLKLLGVNDAVFNEMMYKLLDQNALAFCYNSDRYSLFYGLAKLGDRLVHRKALMRRMEAYMNYQKKTASVAPESIESVFTYNLTHMLISIADERVEQGVGPMF